MSLGVAGWGLVLVAVGGCAAGAAGDTPARPPVPDQVLPVAITGDAELDAAAAPETVAGPNTVTGPRAVVGPDRPQVVPGRLVRDTVESLALAGNLLGQSASRAVIIYLPGGYDADAGNPLRREAYPTLYMFHRYDGRAEDWSNGLYQGFKIQEVMDSLVSWGEMPPAIVVMPDASSSSLGSPYLNSALTGNWEEFLADELVDHVDTKYRTLPEATHRGVAGHSAGGYAALKAAMKHADVFGSVYAMSPCCLALVEEVEELGELGTLLGNVLGMNGDDDTCGGSGAESQVPIKVVQACRENLRSLEGIAMDVGDQDGFESTVPWAKRFSDALTEAQVDHTFEVYAGTHTGRIGRRLLYQVMPFFAGTLAQEGPGQG